MRAEDNREYFEAVEGFLKAIHGLKVKTVCMVALIEDPDTFDVVSVFSAGPMEIAACAGILNVHAAKKYIEVNEEVDPDE